MENARLSFLSIFLLTLSLHVTADLPPSPSPSPSPQSPSPSPSQAITPSPYNHPPASSPVVSFPPPPSPSIPITSSSSPAPSPEDSNSINHIGVDDGTDDSSGEGMSGSKKAGIAIGIIVAASVLMLAGMVYKKRKQNIRRNQYNYAVGRDIVL